MTFGVGFPRSIFQHISKEALRSAHEEKNESPQLFRGCHMNRLCRTTVQLLGFRTPLFAPGFVVPNGGRVAQPGKNALIRSSHREIEREGASMICALGVPQEDFHFADDRFYCVLDEGGTLHAIGAAEEIAWECGREIAFVAWRPGERGPIRESVSKLSLSGYEGVLGIVPAKIPDCEPELLAMLLDIGNEARGGCAVILVVGRADSALCQGILVAP